MTSFSIVTVVYNDVSHIRETMDSIIEQSYKEIEYILIDGNSNDGTKEAIQNYLQTHTQITRQESSDKKIYIEAIHSQHPTLTFKFLSQKDKGIYDAMNKGITLATKEWINFMNCGDRFCNNAVLEKIADEKIENYDIIYGDLNIYYTDQNAHFLKKTSKDLKKLYTLFYHFGHPNCLIKTSVHKQNLFNLHYKLAADYDLIYKLSKQGCSFHFTDITIATFVSGGASDQRGFESLREALHIALFYNQQSFLMRFQIYAFYLFALLKKAMKLYAPKLATKMFLKIR